MIKLGAKELRKRLPQGNETKLLKKNPIYIVADSVIDTYNIGSLFRLADAIAAEKLYLCGEMEYPPSSKIHKAAVGTEGWVPWEKIEKTKDIVTKLKSEGVQIIAVEQSDKAISYKRLEPIFPVAIVVGNETTGINEDVLKLADIIVELPMYGVNKSFNVWGSAAVIAYKVLETLNS